MNKFIFKSIAFSSLILSFWGTQSAIAQSYDEIQRRWEQERLQREQAELLEDYREQLINAYRGKINNLTEPYGVSNQREIHTRLFVGASDLDVEAGFLINVKAVCKGSEPTEPFIQLAPHEDPDMITDAEVDMYYNLYVTALTQLRDSGYCQLADSL